MKRESADKSYEKKLPSSPDTERAVLGAVLLRPEAINVAMDYITEEDFFSEKHRIIFQECCELYEREKAIDLISLIDVLKKKEQLDNAGGAAFIASLLDAVPTSANIESHSRIVREKAILRKIIMEADALLSRSYEDSDNVEKILSEAEHSLLGLEERLSSQRAQPISKLVFDTFKELETLYNRKELITGVPTGYVKLDQMTSGLHKGELIILAARPAMGKTSLALNMALYVAVEKQTPVGFFSLEMSKESLVTRLLCMEAQVDAQKVRTGYVNSNEWGRMTQAASILGNASIYIDDTPALNPSQLRARARILKSVYDIKVLFVDYLQLMRIERRQDNRQQEISEISRSLKAMAKELEIPVIALSQLSREVEKRIDKRPQLSDLRESGAIEQDADLVLFLYRPEVYNIQSIKVGSQDEPSEGKAELIISKQRNGPTGSILLAFLNRFMLFSNLDRVHLPYGEKDTSAADTAEVDEGLPEDHVHFP